MKVYTYCSFDGSKVGFQMGTFRPESTLSDGYYLPEPKGINSTVRKAFENGIIRRIYGKLPKDNSYVVMVKGIKSNTDDNCSTKYCNFAFEFDGNDFNSYSEYRSFIENPQKISEKVNRFLIPDNSVADYAVKINAEQFKNFMNEVSKNTSSVVDSDEKIFFYIETNYQNSDYTEKLYTLFGANNIVRTHNKSIYTNNPKKKQGILKKILPWIAGILLTIAAVWGIVKIIKMIIQIFS